MTGLQRVIIHLINRLQRFYRINMSLNRPFVPKSDVISNDLLLLHMCHGRQTRAASISTEINYGRSLTTLPCGDLIA